MNIGNLPQLQQIMLLSALRGKNNRRISIPVYRVLGVMEPRISHNVLIANYIEEKLEPYADILEEHGYIQWTVVLSEGTVGFLFGQFERRKHAEMAGHKVRREIIQFTDWPLKIAHHNPNNDIIMNRISTNRCRFLRARAPIGVDVYLHEIAAELFYRTPIVGSVTMERIMEDMGVGRFRSTMGALERTMRKLEHGGWVIVVRCRYNRPGIILTLEGYELAKSLRNAKRL